MKKVDSVSRADQHQGNGRDEQARYEYHHKEHEKMNKHRGSLFLDWLSKKTHPEVVTFLIGVLMSSGSWGIFDTIVEVIAIGGIFGGTTTPDGGGTSGGGVTPGGGGTSGNGSLNEDHPLKIAFVYLVFVSAAFWGVYIHHQRKPGVLLGRIGKIEWT